MLSLRPYKKCDGDIIASWIKDEASIFRWSSDRFGSFPITGDMINEKYIDNNGDCSEADNFFPLVACDENGDMVGHLILRYVNGDKSDIRFGFVIVDDSKRGRGYGKELILLAMKYAFDILKAKRVNLGVFDNNPPAYNCYKSAGFREIDGGSIDIQLAGENWTIIEMELNEEEYYA